MQNIAARIKRLEAQGKEETCMIITVHPGQSKEEAKDAYFNEHPHMRDYNGPAPFLFVKMFREKDHA